MTFIKYFIIGMILGMLSLLIVHNIIEIITGLSSISSNAGGGSSSVLPSAVNSADEGVVSNSLAAPSTYTFNDLLDAIEWVESKGDANAMGDAIDRPDCINGSTYPNFDYDHIIGYQFRYFDAHNNPIEYGVKDGKLYAKEYQAVGAYQIHKIYVDDVNRIIRSWKGHDVIHFHYEDRWDRDSSRLMVTYYLNHYYKKSTALDYVIDSETLTEDINTKFERMACIHNGGPDGWKKESTKEYWEKVKNRMETKCLY